jgi:hypothetical protein
MAFGMATLQLLVEEEQRGFTATFEIAAADEAGVLRQGVGGVQGRQVVAHVRSYRLWSRRDGRRAGMAPRYPAASLRPAATPSPQRRSRPCVNGRPYPKTRPSGQHPRRQFLRLAVSAAALPANWRIAMAQSYPEPGGVWHIWCGRSWHIGCARRGVAHGVAAAWRSWR